MINFTEIMGNVDPLLQSLPAVSAVQTHRQTIGKAQQQEKAGLDQPNVNVVNVFSTQEEHSSSVKI